MWEVIVAIGAALIGVVITLIIILMICGLGYIYSSVLIKIFKAIVGESSALAKAYSKHPLPMNLAIFLIAASVGLFTMYIVGNGLLSLYFGE